MDTNIRYRHEIKYLINIEQKIIIENKIKGILNIDRNAKEGKYFVRSIYFDNYNYECLNKVIDGISYRKKYRIRTYNLSKEYICLEKKEKRNNVSIKKQQLIEEKQLNNLLINNNEILSRQQLLDEYIININNFGYKPVCTIDYDRIPYTYETSDIRITFDNNITVSKKTNNMFDEDIEKIPVLNSNVYIMEIKYNEFIPDYIKMILKLENLQPTKFSKYAMGMNKLKQYM